MKSRKIIFTFVIFILAMILSGNCFAEIIFCLGGFDICLVNSVESKPEGVRITLSEINGVFINRLFEFDVDPATRKEMLAITLSAIINNMLVEICYDEPTPLFPGGPVIGPPGPEIPKLNWIKIKNQRSNLVSFFTSAVGP